MEVLQPDRIGHGIQAALDPDVTAHLAEREITLELCPTSNIRTKAVDDLAHFGRIYKSLSEAGVGLTVNTDGPFLLGITVRSEFELLMQAGILTRPEAGLLVARAQSQLPQRITGDRTGARAQNLMGLRCLIRGTKRAALAADNCAGASQLAAKFSQSALNTRRHLPAGLPPIGADRAKNADGQLPQALRGRLEVHRAANADPMGREVWKAGSLRGSDIP